MNQVTMKIINSRDLANLIDWRHDELIQSIGRYLANKTIPDSVYTYFPSGSFEKQYNLPEREAVQFSIYSLNATQIELVKNFFN